MAVVREDWVGVVAGAGRGEGLLGSSSSEESSESSVSTGAWIGSSGVGVGRG